MEAYSDFAYVYDTFMDATPYEKWKNDICVILKEHDISEGIILDLGCGTGTMTRMLRDEGYDMIGVDASFDMLNVARENDFENILYLCQDMREFELYGTVRAVVSVCDCINYLTDIDDIIKTFKLVNNYLDKDGVFIFDFNTVHKYRDVIGDTTIAENREDCSFIWDNTYDEDTGLNQYDVTIFIREDEELFARYNEQHIQRGYELEEIINCLSLAGMEFVKAYDTDSLGPATADSERITVVAKEKAVEGKVYV